jgi:hypothetical protein
MMPIMKMCFATFTIAYFIFSRLFISCTHPSGGFTITYEVGFGEPGNGHGIALITAQDLNAIPIFIEVKCHMARVLAAREDHDGARNRVVGGNSPAALIARVISKSSTTSAPARR